MSGLVLVSGLGLKLKVHCLLRAHLGETLASIQKYDDPIGVAFDGTNVWVANTGDGTVSKVRTNDGVVVGIFPVGSRPPAICFDGTNIWVTNRGDGTVSKLPANDGVTLGTFNVGGLPYGIAFDGVNIWVAGAPQVMVLRARDGKQVDRLDYSGNATIGMAFDGANMWTSVLNLNALAKM
jgi:DNA-binding beta-propeller fold protein YncE